MAIYNEHDNGDVTVYGHIETIYVSASQQVAADQEIAGVGSRGFSTAGTSTSRCGKLEWAAPGSIRSTGSARGVYR